MTEILATSVKDGAFFGLHVQFRHPKQSPLVKNIRSGVGRQPLNNPRINYIQQIFLACVWVQKEGNSLCMFCLSYYSSAMKTNHDHDHS